MVVVLGPLGLADFDALVTFLKRDAKRKIDTEWCSLRNNQTVLQKQDSVTVSFPTLVSVRFPPTN